VRHLAWHRSLRKRPTPIIRCYRYITQGCCAARTSVDCLLAFIRASARSMTGYQTAAVRTLYRRIEAARRCLSWPPSRRKVCRMTKACPIMNICPAFVFTSGHKRRGCVIKSPKHCTGIRHASCLTKYVSKLRLLTNIKILSVPGRNLRLRSQSFRSKRPDPTRCLYGDNIRFGDKSPSRDEPLPMPGRVDHAWKFRRKLPDYQA